jgi:hypothetical protein
LINTHTNTQDAPLVTQNHEKNPQKNKIKKGKYNYNINSSKCHIIECDKVFKYKNKIEKCEKKYNAVQNVVWPQMAHSPSNKRQEGMPHHTTQHKLTNDTKCHLYKNDIININIYEIKPIAYHNNKTKYTQ